MIEKIKAISKFLSWALVLFFAYLLFSPVASFAAIDTIAVDVGISVFKTMPIGIVPFTETKGAIEWIEEKPSDHYPRCRTLWTFRSDCF